MHDIVGRIIRPINSLLHNSEWEIFRCMYVTYQATDTVNVDEISYYKQHGAAHVFLFIEGFHVFYKTAYYDVYYRVLCCNVSLSIILFTFWPIM